MKSPYDKQLDPFNNRTLPEQEERLITMAYDFLGWNPTPDQHGAFEDCLNKAHNYYSAFPNAWKEERHTPSGSEVTRWCTICKHYWKVDIS